MDSHDQLAAWVRDARARSIRLTADLDDEALTVPLWPTINPLLWELCHAAYFQEYWVLRRACGREPLRADADALFDSATVGHEERWRLPLPTRADALRYVEQVRDRVLGVLEGELPEQTRYLIAYSVFHEDMHAEAFAYARQTLGYATPSADVCPQGRRGDAPASDALPTDVAFAGGTYRIGAEHDGSFCFDNEKWAHEVELAPFALRSTATTEAEFAEFVLDGGYARPELWSHEGFAWVQAQQAELPQYWRRAGSGFERRVFDRWVPVGGERAMTHVNWYEADAWARWAGRRLPSEAEWEVAACGGTERRRFPWGDQVAEPGQCSLDWMHVGAIAAGALERGATRHGLRQMLGNVWEWTSSTFRPYPGFVADMYADYSTTSFATRKVLRGGCWATSSRMLRNTWRNYYQPFRRDVFAGFRTCAC